MPNFRGFPHIPGNDFVLRYPRQGDALNGAPLFPDISLATLFQDPFAEGDVRCLYDSATQTFFFTEIGFPPGGPNPALTNTTLDVTVLNKQGAAFYQFDTSFDNNHQSGNCLGDQPKVGFNNNALVVSTDQFCGPTLSGFQGALVLAISKPQLVAEATTELQRREMLSD